MDKERPNELQKISGVSQDRDLLKDFIGEDAESAKTSEYAQQCLAIYEETLRAMGLLVGEEISESVDNSQLIYARPEPTEGEYVNLQECY